MCETQYQMQTCLWRKEDGTREWIYRESPAFRGQIVPHIHDVERLEDGTVVREHNGKREVLRYIWDGLYIQHYIQGEGYFLYLVCPTLNVAVRNKGEIFSYFRFFSDGSVECRDKGRKLWRFSAPQYYDCGEHCKDCGEHYRRCECDETPFERYERQSNSYRRRW